MFVLPPEVSDIEERIRDKARRKVYPIFLLLFLLGVAPSAIRTYDANHQVAIVITLVFVALSATLCFIMYPSILRTETELTVAAYKLFCDHKSKMDANYENNSKQNQRV